MANVLWNMQNSMVLPTYFFPNWKYLFLSKLVPKNQTGQFKLIFGDQVNLNMQRSIVMFTFSVFDQKYSLSNFTLKKQF